MKDKGRPKVAKQARVLERLTVEYVPLESIRPNTYNPNRQDPHEFELLLRSMREDGFTQPVIVQTVTREIVDGEHRWRAASELGFKEIPVVFVDMSVEQMRVSTLRHNRARGAEDLALSAQVIRDLEKLGAIEWAKDSLMLDDVELARLLEDVSAPDALSADQYGEAWAPQAGSDRDMEVETAPVDSQDGQILAGATVAAADRRREMESRVAQAKNDEERAAARRDGRMFRLSLSFAGEEAEIIRTVLGARPAERLLELCRAVADTVVAEEGG